MGIEEGKIEYKYLGNNQMIPNTDLSKFYLSESESTALVKGIHDINKAFATNEPKNADGNEAEGYLMNTIDAFIQKLLEFYTNNKQSKTHQSQFKMIEEFNKEMVQLKDKLRNFSKRKFQNDQKANEEKNLKNAYNKKIKELEKKLKNLKPTISNDNPTISKVFFEIASDKYNFSSIKDFMGSWKVMERNFKFVDIVLKNQYITSHPTTKK